MYFHFIISIINVFVKNCKGSKISLYLQADSLTWHSFIDACKNTWTSGVTDKDLHYLWLSKKHKLQVLNLMWAMPWWALVDAVHTSEKWWQCGLKICPVCMWMERDYTAWTTKWTLYPLVNTIFKAICYTTDLGKSIWEKLSQKDIELFLLHSMKSFTIMVQWNRCNTIKQKSVESKNYHACIVVITLFYIWLKFLIIMHYQNIIHLLLYFMQKSI